VKTVLTLILAIAEVCGPVIQKIKLLMKAFSNSISYEIQIIYIFYGET